MTAGAEPSAAGVDLAQEPDFRLGGMRVSPSACRVRTAAGDQRVEPRVMQVLVVLARHAGHTVSRDQLIESCWDGRIVSDDAISRVIAQVRSLARGHAPSPFELETVPKVGFRLVASGDAPGEPPPNPPWPWWRRRRALIAAGLVFALAAVAGLVVLRSGQGGLPSQNGRLEVVRFEVRRPEPALQRLSTDLGDSLVRVLSVAGDDVAPHVAAPGDGGSANDAELRIAGSVDRDGSDIVLNAQILDRRTGLVLLSQRHTRPADVAAGFADEVAGGVASALQCALEDRRWSRRRMEPSVFALYLNTCDAITREGNMPRMLESARRLVRAAPKLAVAHAMYGIAQANSTGGTDLPADEDEALRRGARASAEQALKLDPRTPKAYIAIANSHADDGNWEVRETSLRRARAIDPNLNPGRLSLSTLLRQLGRLHEAREVLSQVSASGDPRTGRQEIPMALVYAQTGDLAAAEEQLRSAERVSPGENDAVRWTIAVWWGDPAKAREASRRLGARRHTEAELACMDRHLARVEAGTPVRGLPPGCEVLSPDWRIRMLSREGDVDGAYAEFAKARATSRPLSLYFLYYPEMKAFRADPRFMPLARSLGLVDYWLKSNRWPDFCAEPDLPYDCKAVAHALVAKGKA